MKSDFDVAIVGGSVAGSSLAIQTKETPLSIALIEKSQLPRRKTCGEGLSGAGVFQLQKLGIEWSEMPHQPLEGYVIYRAGRKIWLPFSGDEKSRPGIGVERTELDSLLFSRAAATVRTVIRDRAAQIDNMTEGCRIRFASGRELTADYVVDATGIRSVSHRKSHSGRKAALRFGFSFHADLLQPLELFNVLIGIEREFEVYLTPTGHSRVNIAVMARKPYFHALAARAPENILRHCSKQFGLRLRALDTPVAFGPIAAEQRPEVQGRIIAIGDAAEQFDPIGGMGMTHALQSAAFAAEAFGAIAKGVSYREAFRRYRRNRSSGARTLRGFTRLTQFILARDLSFRVLSKLAGTRLPREVCRAVHDTDHCAIPTQCARTFVRFVGA